MIGRDREPERDDVTGEPIEDERPDLPDDIKQHVRDQRAKHADDPQPVIEVDGRRLS